MTLCIEIVNECCPGTYDARKLADFATKYFDGLGIRLNQNAVIYALLKGLFELSGLTMDEKRIKKLLREESRYEPWFVALDSIFREVERRQFKEASKHSRHVALFILNLLHDIEKMAKKSIDGYWEKLKITGKECSKFVKIEIDEDVEKGLFGT